MGNVIYVIGRVSRIRKTIMPNGRIAYNFGIASKQGYGEYEQTIFFEASAFIDPGAQEKFYDSVLVKGNKLPFLGYMTIGKPYVDANGTKIEPWVLQVSQIGTGLNQVFLTGHLTDNAIVTVKKDLVIVRFTIAVNKKKDGADFLKVVKFGKGGFKGYAEKYLTKGQPVIVSGRATSGVFETRDGQKSYTYEIVANEIELYGQGKKEEGNSAKESPVPKKQPLVYDPNIPQEFMSGIIGIDEPLPFV